MPVVGDLVDRRCPPCWSSVPCCAFGRLDGLVSDAFAEEVAPSRRFRFRAGADAARLADAPMLLARRRSRTCGRRAAAPIVNIALAAGGCRGPWRRRL